MARECRGWSKIQDYEYWETPTTVQTKKDVGNDLPEIEEKDSAVFKDKDKELIFG